MAHLLDVIIFGASGFTGKATVIEAVRILSKHSWGIAGRNENKLKAVLKEAGEKTKQDLSKIPIIIADVDDEDSLKRMAKQAKVIVNLCGPFRLYGEPVVKACIDAGTHHLDISGEIQYIEGSQLKYNELAKEKGVYAISTCGMDSIPAEMGVKYLEDNFNGQINSIEGYLNVGPSQKMSDTIMNYGTWASLVYGIGHAGETVEIKRKLFPNKLPDFKPIIEKRPILFKSPSGKWSATFPGADRDVVERTQRKMWEDDKKRPIQYRQFISFPSLLFALVTIVYGIFVALMSKLSCGRYLLLTYPKVFSFGLFSTDGPSEEVRKNTFAKLSFYAKGWPKQEQIAGNSDQYTGLPTKIMSASISCVDPAYAATGAAILVSATMILNKRSKMPGKGGVLPPGAAFGKTNIIEELSKNGFKFELTD